jgi:hypothetical protein
MRGVMRPSNASRAMYKGLPPTRQRQRPPTPDGEKFARAPRPPGKWHAVVLEVDHQQ